MGKTRTSLDPELLLAVHREGPEALHRQLEQELRDAIRSGRLVRGSVLPSTRALAQELDLSRGVVVEAYEQLTAEGYLASRPGGKTRVSERAAEPAAVGRTDGARAKSGAVAVARDPGSVGTRGEAAVDAVAIPGRSAAPGAPSTTSRATVPSADAGPQEARPPFDFAYGRPDVTQFPRQVWLRSLRRVLNEAPSDRFSYLGGQGAPELREALAGYLNRVRGTAARPERILITNGFAQALRLVLDVVRKSGGKRVAVEDPGQNDTRFGATDLGLKAIPVPVDDAGLVVDRLLEVDAQLCVVTPAHEFPTGAVLSPDRRAGLIQWARERGALVLEDDYDAEYRYDREPIGALQGLAPDEVIYAGSASKTLAPGLRLGWLILPERLVERFALAKVAIDRGSPSIEQLAFADFLTRGEFDRHLRRMRPIYRARRDALLRALARHLPELHPVGASAGLHVLAWLPDGIDERGVVARALARGVGLDGLAPYRSAGVEASGPGGLILGYARLSESEIEEGIRRLAEVLREA
jgi:GntR family transcriptional regulator/MocR family aminotransferase